MSLKSFIKGYIGEVQGTIAQKIFLDPNIYVDLNNVTIQTSEGTTQIDHIIVSPFGIFVVETKNMNGWIFGDEKKTRWVQILFGKKYNFQNPIHQNYKHTKALSDFLLIDHSKFISVVMFWGECEFKTPLPPNVINMGYSSYIKSHLTVRFSDHEVKEIVTTIKERSLPKSLATHRQHTSFLKNRFSSTTICPKCGNSLVPRIAKSGVNKGSRFYGCIKYPICKYIINE